MGWHPLKHSVNWARLGLRVAALWRAGAERTPDLVRESYDRISTGYDAAWTCHMRDLTADLLQRLDVRPQMRCLDLTCGTGFASTQLAQRGACVTGVDASPGMLTVARHNAPTVEFIESDILAYLQRQPDASFDLVTCAWGLGYSQPRAVIAQCGRVLGSAGHLAVIDNSLFSLREMIWTSFRAFAHHPHALSHAMRVGFLPSAAALCRRMRSAGLRPTWHDAGERRYLAATGHAAIERLRATGAAAGFEFAADDASRDAVNATFAKLLEARYGDQIPIVHRYIAAIAQKGTP